MKLFVFAICAVFLSVQASDDGVDPDAKAFMMSISMGRGLYYNFPDIALLNATNFDSTVQQKEVSWLIEFYNSWCGHCLRYTPTFKRFAADVKGWSSVVKVGAVDCSNELNTPLCRDYEILGYPTLRYFPPKFEKGFYGTEVQKRKIEELEEAVVELLMNRTDLGGLHLFTGTSKELWDRSGEARYIALYVDCHEEPSSVGPELVLDYLPVNDVHMARARCSNLGLLNGLKIIGSAGNSALYVIPKFGPSKLLQSGAPTRPEALQLLHTYFDLQGIQTPTPFNLSSIKEININLKDAYLWASQYTDMVNKILSNKHIDQVFQVDIEGAVRTTFNVEIPRKKHINGTLFTALKNYVDVLTKYFPAGENGRNFIQCVKHGLDSKTALNGLTGTEFSEVVGLCAQRYHPVWLDSEHGWLGCRGTLPTYRGFPCSMWTMFHTLTVQAWYHNAADPQEVLQAMIGYIGNFFGCSDCTEHFLKVAATMAGNVSTLEDSVLWLWNAHNKANQRLHGDATEDPNFPKVQFPPPSICPNCYNQRGLFDEKEVLSFLRQMYTNISYIVIEDIKTTSTPTVGYVSPKLDPKRAKHETPVQAKLLRHDVIVDETREPSEKRVAKLLWDFSLFDVSLCVVLYIVSMGIIVLVCIKFLKNRRTYRKKPYYNDIS